MAHGMHEGLQSQETVQAAPLATTRTTADALYTTEASRAQLRVPRNHCAVWYFQTMAPPFTHLIVGLFELVNKNQIHTNIVFV